MENSKFREGIIASISYLYIFLFVYAAVSKLLDFENFQVQIGQSPLLSAFAGWISWAVPIAELGISAALLLRWTRFYGLFLAYLLMVLFTAYIVIILNYSSSIPCSCGGILEQLGWREHLWLNIGFIVLAVGGILLLSPGKRLLRTFALLLIGALAGTVSMIVLYKVSHRITSYHNTFIRNFPKAARKLSEIDLGYNSYYFAGADSGKVYLGNYTAPLEILVLEESARERKHFRISLDVTDLPFRSMHVRVKPPYFYAYDGTVSCLYAGSSIDWKGKLKFKGKLFFDQVVTLDQARFAFREQQAGRTVLGFLDLSQDVQLKYNTGLLQRQMDGVFDVDGKLLSDPSSRGLVYIYSYRNQFTAIDRDLNVRFRATTIDTISHARLHIASVSNRGQRKLGAPPLTVNKSATVYRGLLFVHSAIPGRYEPIEMWKVASIVDIYDLEDHAYITSIYVHDIDGKRMGSFIVEGNLLYAMAGRRVALYELDKLVTSKYK